MARPLDPTVDEAILTATLEQLTQLGFARMTVEGVAVAAGVGKPAIYRRYRDKAELVAAVIKRQLAPLEPSDLGDTRKELWHAVKYGFPQDGPSYVGLIGGLIAEHQRHPELIEAFRHSVLHPRRAAVLALIERGVERGDLRDDIDPTTMLDLLAGPLLARIYAGADTGPRWQKRAFSTWWELLSSQQDPLSSPRPSKSRQRKTGVTHDRTSSR